MFNKEAQTITEDIFDAPYPDPTKLHGLNSNELKIFFKKVCQEDSLDLKPLDIPHTCYFGLKINRRLGLDRDSN